MLTGDELAKLRIPIGKDDRHGNPIHLGDWLRFDYHEWYRSKHYLLTIKGEPWPEEPEPEFQILIDGGEILMWGTPDDLESWCEIIEPPQGR